MRYLTATDAKALIDRLSGETWLCAMLQWRAGLRISEALALRPDDIDLKTGTLTVQSGKGGKRRTVPLHPELRMALRATRKPLNNARYFMSNLKTKDRSGRTRRRRQLGRSTMYRRYVRYAIPGTHVLRHSAARHWLSEGVTVNQVQLLLGHSQLETTLRYLELVDPTPGVLEHVT